MPVCPSCAAENQPDARFCSSCGARLDSARGRTEERKVVTVLFSDVTGSTGLAQRLDPEELREVMGMWFAAVRSEIETQGGTVEKFIGDAVMAVFGVPAAHEDDPARALRAALAITTRLVGLNAQLEASHGIGIEIRTGINTGEAVATPDPPAGEAMVTGLAVNEAARLEQLAEPGQTLVAERTVRSAAGFRFHELGLRELRGSTEPVRAFLLLAEEGLVGTRGLPGVQAPLVGRDRELDLLLSLPERVIAESRPHLVTIYGDPGVGKSRLVRELLARVADAPAAPRILFGRCLSYGEGIAHWPLAEILRELAGIADDEPAEQALARIDVLVGRLLAGGSAAERNLIVASLAFTLGLDSGSPEFEKLQPSALRQELHRAWRVVLSAAAIETPLVVVIEDIHWADPVLLELLEEIAERAQGPILFVCPSRPELTDRYPGWGGGRRNFSAVSLAPLPPEAARTLVGHLLDVDGLPEEMRTRILERAEGNPFFLEEILRHLIDKGGVARDGARWTATEELTHVELPDTVQAVLAARIDLLDPSQKHTLQQASVVGRIFWKGAVAELVADRTAVDPDLRRLEDRELVLPRLVSSLAGQEELAFKHILTRDVAYESLPRRERPGAHARVAGWIEETTGDRSGEFVGLLAYHYGEAYRGARLDRSFDPGKLDSLRRRALELMLDASAAALRAAAFAAGQSLAESALELASDPAEQAAALEVLARGYGYAARGDDAWRCYSRAVDTLVEAGSDDGERIARLCGRALEVVCRWTGTMTEVPEEAVATRYLELGLERLGEGESEGRVRLLSAQSFWSHPYPDSSSPFRDPEPAQEAGVAAAAIAERIGRPDLAVVALDGVQHNLQRRLLFRETQDSCNRRLELARTAGDLNELGDSFAVTAWNAIYLGNFAEARSVARECYDQLQFDAPLYVTHAMSWGALASFYLGDWDQLLDDFELVRAGLGDRADTPTSGYSAPWPAVALVHEARGDTKAADRLLEQVYSIERDRGSVSRHLSPLVVRTLVLRGAIADARRRVDALAEQPGVYGDEALMMLARVDLLVAEERWDELLPLAAAARELGATSGARYLVPLAERIEGYAARAAGDGDGAVRHLEAAAAGFDAVDMSVDAALARLDAAETLHALDRLDEARGLAARAAGPLERAGHRPALARLAAVD